MSENNKRKLVKLNEGVVIRNILELNEYKFEYRGTDNRLHTFESEVRCIDNNGRLYKKVYNEDIELEVEYYLKLYRGYLKNTFISQYTEYGVKEVLKQIEIVIGIGRIQFLGKRVEFFIDDELILGYNIGIREIDVTSIDVYNEDYEYIKNWIYWEKDANNMKVKVFIEDRKDENKGRVKFKTRYDLYNKDKCGIIKIY